MQGLCIYLALIIRYVSCNDVTVVPDGSDMQEGIKHLVNRCNLKHCVNMKSYFSIIVFIVLAASSVVAGTGSYIDTQRRIATDLNRALVRALAEKGQDWVNADTIRVCKQLQAQSSGVVMMVIRDDCFAECLLMPELRGRSYVTFAVVPNGRAQGFMPENVAGVSGDTVIMKPEAARKAGVSIALRGNADCSFATVFGLSDLRLSVALMVAAVLWGVFSLSQMRRRVVAGMSVAGCNQLGGLRFDPSLNAFYNSVDEEARFTPMQFQFMRMFFNAEGHKLSKSKICESLWPGKDDASETLYTLVRRLKRVVEQNSSLKIEAERGRAYKLTVNGRRPDKPLSGKCQ